MSLETILSNLLESPGALGAAFLDPQGEVVARAGDEAATEVLGAYQSVWLAELGRAAERSGLGSVANLALDFDGRPPVRREGRHGRGPRTPRLRSLLSPGSC